MPLTESQFRLTAEAAISKLEDVLYAASERYGYDIDRKENTLEIHFEEPEPATFVISPNIAARQIWISALANSHKFNWAEERSDFIHHKTGEALVSAVSRLMAEQLGAEPDLLLENS
ncbi:MAG: iron donor protein CyaY [Acidobacteria bacterium]|nr:iron donor protein CyaY [Acidobacteriota bacterium]